MRKRTYIVASTLAAIMTALLVTWTVVGAAGQTATEPIERTAAEEILVSPEWIQEHGEELVILDYGRSPEDFAEGHIPGAAFVPRSVAWDTVDGVGGMLPDPELVARDLEDAGVRTDRPVVIYDAGNGLWASRLFWALEYLGHTSVHILDGGITTWTGENNTISREIVPPVRGDFQPDLRPQLLADAAYVLEHLEGEQSRVAILDTRSPDEYNGTDVRAERGGHIPGSTNIEWTAGLKEGRFRPIAELASAYADVLEQSAEVITLCQTGVRGAHTYVVLRTLGHEDVRVYDGSWAEWGNDPDLPVEL